MALKEWKKGKFNSWVRKDGVPITQYGRTQLYPFIQLGKNYSTKTGTYDSYRVMVHGTHTTEMLYEGRTKSEAFKYARCYMQNSEKGRREIARKCRGV